MSIYRQLYLSGLFFVIIFIAAMFAFERSNNSFIEFSAKEKLGNIYQRPLVSILNDIITHRQMIHMGEISGQQNRNEIWEIENKINQSFNTLKSLESTIGKELQFTTDGLASRKREELLLDKVRGKWDELKDKTSRANHTDTSENYKYLIENIRGMIAHAGDISNLILDPDLDSYYIMDSTLVRLPQTIDRLGVIMDMLSAIKNSESERHKLDTQIKLTTIGSLLKEADIDVISGNFDRVFKEDKNFYGISANLVLHLEPLIKNYLEANNDLAEKLIPIPYQLRINDV